MVGRAHVWKVATPATAVTAEAAHVTPKMATWSAAPVPVVTWLPKVSSTRPPRWQRWTRP